jgi:prolipoprotein diacylglyceryltransferase
MHWPTYRRDPRRIWRRPEGGMAMYGAVPTTLPVSLPLLAWLAVPYWEFWDVSVFCILVIMIAARLGCFLHACCSGRVSDGWLALRLPDTDGVRARRVPTQLLEIAWTLVLLAGAIVAWPHLETPGTLFLATVAGYGLGRLALQPTRAVRERRGGIDVSLALWGGTALLAVVSLMARA